MKNFVIAAFMLGTAATANAGAVTFTPPQAAVLEEPARMGGSGAWIIPVVIAAVVLLAVSNNCNEGNSAELSAKVPTCRR